MTNPFSNLEAEIYTDGGSRGNPGPSACGAVILINKVPVKKAGKFLGDVTNNVAEYEGLILGLEEAIKLHVKKIKVFCDSKLIVKQSLGEWRIKKPHLLPFAEKVQDLLKSFETYTITHIHRHYNVDADVLVNKVLDEEEKKNENQ